MRELHWIVAVSLRFRYLVVFLSVVLIIFGISQVRTMSVDVFPEFAPPRVEIQTPSLGLNSAEVEALVTVPLEEAFNGMPGLDIMRSKSVEQLSSILLIFKPEVDLMEARQAVQERLSVVQPTLRQHGPARPCYCPRYRRLPEPSKSGYPQKNIPS